MVSHYERHSVTGTELRSVHIKPVPRVGSAQRLRDYQQITVVVLLTTLQRTSTHNTDVTC